MENSKTAEARHAQLMNKVIKGTLMQIRKSPYIYKNT